MEYNCNNLGLVLPEMHFLHALREEKDGHCQPCRSLTFYNSLIRIQVVQ